MSVSIADSLEALTSQWSAVPYQQTGASDRFVLGDVRLEAKVLLIGEAPGEDEDREGIAFCGRAGRRLDETLGMVGLPRQTISAANVFPRRPRDNKMTDDLRREAVKAHGPFLDRLVSLHPNLKAVGLMGATALQWKAGVSKIEDHLGDEFRKGSLWFVPMYHPAATLYRRSNHRWLLRDLAWLKALAEGNVMDTAGMEFPFVDDPFKMAPLSRLVRESPIVYVDIEATAEPPAKALHWWDPRSKPVVLSFGWFESDRMVPKAAVVEYNELTRWAVRDLLATPEPYWGGSNALYFDFPFLRRIGCPPSAVRTPLDSYPIAKLNDENRGLGLKDLAKQHLRAVNHVPWWGDAEGEAWHGRWAEWPSMPAEERAERIAYSGKDAWLGIQVLRREVDAIKRNPRLVKFYRDAVIPQAEGIEEMNGEGLPVNPERARAMEATLAAKAEEIQARLAILVPEGFRSTPKSISQGELFESVGPAINFNSPPQVAALLERAGFPRVSAGGKKKNKTDRPSADRFVLLRLQGLPHDRYPDWAFQVIDGVLDLRDAVKEKGFIRSKRIGAGIIAGVERSHDGRLHPTFKATTVTWRTAAEDPNAQQYPPPIKSLVEAPDGKVLVKFDHASLEMRGLADQSGDPKMIRRVLAGDDMHWRHATSFMAIPYESPKEKPIRDAFKTLGFATGYGAGDEKVADTLRNDFRDAGIGPDTVRRILDARGVPHGEDVYLTLAREWLAFLDAEYPRMKSEFRRLVSQAKREGFVRSKFGFARRLPDLDSEDNGARGDAERQAWNLDPQSLSMLTWIAWRELRHIRDDMGLERAVRLILQEHDSLLFLCDEDIAPLWYSVVEAVMPAINWSEWGATFAVPLKVEGSITRHWA